MNKIIDTCKGWNCPHQLKSKCYRHQLYDEDYQEFAYEEPPFEILENSIRCNQFWSTKYKPTKQKEINKCY